MAFNSSSDNFMPEREIRREAKGKLLPFGVNYLDDALLGIRPDDMIIVGAPSGVGKTQFCTTLALASLEQERRVHYFALEADEFEIERRLRFGYLANLFYADPEHPRLGRPLIYDEWECGMYEGELDHYEEQAQKYCEGAFRNLYTFYKEAEFSVQTLMAEFAAIAHKTDLIIVDHVHYFDWSGNDNDAMKEIAKTARDLVNQFKIPMVLVAHLRKGDKNSKELVAGLDEFHGSSDLAKIATKAITIASGGPNEDGPGFVTFMRTPKNRKGGGATRYYAKMIYDDRTGAYLPEYELASTKEKTFIPTDGSLLPSWYGRTKRRTSGDRDTRIQRRAIVAT